MDSPTRKGSSPEKREPLPADPESPDDIVRENPLFVLAVALLVLLAVLALLIAFAG